jgi:FkbM family methyltransferase
MKIRELLHVIGLRPDPKTYGFEIRGFELPKDGTIEYAQWLHPRETGKAITQASVDALREFLKPGDVAIDIGAHTGDTTLPMALAVGPAGCVLALEPNKYVFPVLQKNAELNPGKTRILPLMFAATPEDGSLTFEYSDEGFCNGGRHEGISRWKHGHAFKLSVEGKNLESYLRRNHPELIPRIRYVKVDAEGYDLVILQSLAGLIAERHPYIRAEVFKHTSAEQRRALYGFLEGHGYAIHRMDTETTYLRKPLTIEEMTQWPHFDIFGRYADPSAGIERP